MTEDRKRVPKGFEASAGHSRFSRFLGPYHVAELPGDDGGNDYWIGLKIDERHAGRGNYGHGAVLLSMLDEIMGHAASRSVDRVCVTVSMQTNFCEPFELGDFLRATAVVMRRGNSLVFMEGKVLAGDSLIATASGVWANSGKPIPTAP